VARQQPLESAADVFVLIYMAIFINTKLRSE